MSPAAAPLGARPRVLMLSPYFLPAQQGGGSVQAVLHLTQHLHESFDFVIASRDHDLRSRQQFETAAQQAARLATGLDIRYLPGGLSGMRALRQLLHEHFDLVYLHSLMALDLGLWPLICQRWLGGPSRPVLIAPRGELMPGALTHRTRAKQAYLALLRSAGLLRGTQFHATTDDEAHAISAQLRAEAPIHIAPDLPPLQARAAGGQEAPRAPGPLRVLFLSRIDPVKNLGFALRVLSGMDQETEFNIAGPIGNDEVWADCQRQMQDLPPHVRARYLGAVPHADVAGLMVAHDILFLPTLGENHGYVIAEALSAGCPVLTSDRTPWRGLQRAGVGADLPLEDEQAFRRALVAQAVMPDSERSEQRARCSAYIQQRQLTDDSAPAMRRLLERICQPKARMPSTSSGQSGGL